MTTYFLSLPCAAMQLALPNIHSLETVPEQIPNAAARAVWNGTPKASLASVQQGRMGFVWLFFKQGSILASESLLLCIKDSLLQRCDGKQFEKLCVISGVVLIALLTGLEKSHKYKSC